MRKIVIMPGGFHPFHAGHAALYKSAVKAFNDADVYVAATNDTKTRPFPFAIKEKLAKLAGVADKHFVQVKSPFQPREITDHYNPAEDVLIFVRSEKDRNESPKPGGTKKDGTPAYFQPWTGKDVQPFGKHAYIAYLPTVEFGPGITSATEIRNAWPTLNDKRKTAMVMSLYPVTQKNPKLAANVVKMLDMGMGNELSEGSLNEFVPPSSEGGGENERSRRIRKLLEIAIQVAKEKNVDELGMIHAMNMIAGDDYFNVAVEGILPDITDKEYMFVLQNAYKTVKQGLAEGKLVESAVFLNPTTVVVGQAHGQPLELSPNTLKQIQAIAAKHGAWYEGNGTDRGYTKGQIDRYVGSWDDEVAKTANSNDPKWLYVLFANVDENNRVQRVGVDPNDTIFNRLLATAKDNSFQGIGYTSQALQKFLQMTSEGKYDFLKMSQQPATQENLTRFLKAGEALMWPSNWEQYPNKAGKIAKAATVDVRDQYLATRKAGVYVTGSGHLKAVQNITGKQGVAEGVPQPGKSSGKPISWIDPTKVVTEYLTLDEIFKSVSGIPYYNNVVTDRDNKDFTWGVTKRVIQYAKELVIRPDAYKNWPPIIVLDGKLQDGAHRISTIYLMQQRVQPNNPIWKNAKLKVEFGTSDNVKQGLAEEVNPEVTSNKYTAPSQNVRMGDFVFNARKFTGGLGEPNAKGLQIRAYDPKNPKGQKSIGSADFIVKQDKKGNQWLESDDTEVEEEYRGRGVAAMMYAFAKTLGNDIKPSDYKSMAGHTMWSKWGSDAKHLVGEQAVVEGDVVPFKQPSKTLTWKQVPKDVLLLANDWLWAEYDNTGLAATIDPEGFGNGTANDMKYIAAKLQQKGWTIDFNDEYDGPGEFNLRLTNKRGQTVLLSIEDAQSFTGWAKGTSSYDLEESYVTKRVDYLEEK